MTTDMADGPKCCVCGHPARNSTFFGDHYCTVCFDAMKDKYRDPDVDALDRERIRRIRGEP